VPQLGLLSRFSYMSEKAFCDALFAIPICRHDCILLRI
jgi:hypothetical protein